MGLLGTRPCPSFSDVAHDGVFVHLEIDQPQTGQVMWSGGYEQMSSIFADQ
jgi:hypothetical protein